MEQHASNRLIRPISRYVGEPVPGVEHKIADNGEVLVKSPGNMMGYFKAKQMSDELFTDDGFLHTGDQENLNIRGAALHVAGDLPRRAGLSSSASLELVTAAQAGAEGSQGGKLGSPGFLHSF